MDDKQAVPEALSALGDLGPKLLYLSALQSVQGNSPSQITQEERAQCNAAYERLFAAADASISDHFVIEALLHCTKTEGGWCM